jgi:hypothetical protein
LEGFVENKNVSWKTAFRRPPPTKDGTLVSVHYPRLLALNLLFAIPNFTSLLLIFFQDVYRVIDSRSIALAGVKLDLQMGIYWFSYRMSSTDSIDNSNLFPTNYVTDSYHDYCTRVDFLTRTGIGSLFDQSVFCGRLWTMAQAFQSAAVSFGILFIILVIDNIAVWQNRSWWFFPNQRPVKHVRRLRRLFKGAILCSVFLHWICQTVTLSIVFYLVKWDQIKYPSPLFLYIGFYIPVIVTGLDILFMIAFGFYDKFTFFHEPIDSGDVKDVE